MSDLLVARTVQALQAAFAGITGVEKIESIEPGRLQDSPVDEKHFIRVHIGDPEAPGKWEDSYYGARDQGIDRGFITTAANTIGGGNTWWRRLTVDAYLYGMKGKLPREDARRLANVTRARIERALAASPLLRGFTDSFGEVAILPLVVTSSASEGGGPKASYIWRIKVRFQVLTERAN
jgi:hypothetical protein